MSILDLSLAGGTRIPETAIYNMASPMGSSFVNGWWSLRRYTPLPFVDKLPDELSISSVLTYENTLALRHAISDLYAEMARRSGEEIIWSELAKRFQDNLTPELIEAISAGLHTPAIHNQVTRLTYGENPAGDLYALSRRKQNMDRRQNRSAITGFMDKYTGKEASLYLCGLRNTLYLITMDFPYVAAFYFGFVLAEADENASDTDEYMASTYRKIDEILVAIMQKCLEVDTMSDNFNRMQVPIPIRERKERDPQTPVGKWLSEVVGTYTGRFLLAYVTNLVEMPLFEGMDVPCIEPRVAVSDIRFTRQFAPVFGSELPKPQTLTPVLPEYCGVLKLGKAGVPYLQAVNDKHLPVILLPATMECALFLAKLYRVKLPDPLMVLPRKSQAIWSTLFVPDRFAVFAKDEIAFRTSREWFDEQDMGAVRIVNSLVFLGRHSLTEYMGQEPSSAPNLQVNEMLVPVIPIFIK